MTARAWRGSRTDDRVAARLTQLGEGSRYTELLITFGFVDFGYIAV